MGFVRRRPFTFGVLGVLVAVYVVEIAQSQPDFWVSGGGELPDIAAWGAVWSPGIAAGEWWRLVTAGFLHGGLRHLAFNGYALLVIGDAAERRLGSERTAAVFLAAVIGGDIAAALVDQNVVSLGASGGIMGLAGAVVVAAIRSKEGLKRSQLVISAIVLTILNGFVNSGISNSGHIGGLLAGAGAGWLLGMSGEYASSMQRRRARRQEEVVAAAARLDRNAGAADFNTNGGVMLKASRSFAVIAVLGLVLFGLPLAINVVTPFAPPVVTILCALFVVASLVMLGSIPSISLTLTNEGFVYRPPYWRRTITVPWDAVLDVSTYEVSTGYSKQSFAQVKYVATTPTGPHEHRMLFNRLGNLKAARLAELIEEHRRRIQGGVQA